MHARRFSRELARRGHRVLWWNTAFDHFRKEWIHDLDMELEIDENVHAVAMKGTGYKTNTSVARIIDHRLIARKWTRLAKARPKPDLIIAAMPPHDLAYQAVKFARRKGIPSILDLRDPWPDALVDLLPRWLRSTARFAIARDAAMLRYAIRECDSLTAVTQTLLEWGQAKVPQREMAMDCVSYTGAPNVESVDQSGRVAAIRQQVDDGFPVIFVGSFGHYHSPGIAIDAARRLESEKVHFILAGSGATMESLQMRAAGLSNVHFPGWLDASESAALMRMGKVGICPTSYDQPILPNKAAAYFREGLPVVSSFSGDLHQLIADSGAGINFVPGDLEGFTAAVLRIRNDEALRIKMSGAARRLYCDKLDSNRNVARLGDHAESVASRQY